MVELKGGAIPVSTVLRKSVKKQGTGDFGELKSKNFAWEHGPGPPRNF